MKLTCNSATIRNASEGYKSMRVSLNLIQQTNCQPLRRFSGREDCCPNPRKEDCNNLALKYDLACRIIALQKQQILALQEAKSEK